MRESTFPHHEKRNDHIRFCFLFFSIIWEKIIVGKVLNSIWYSLGKECLFRSKEPSQIIIENVSEKNQILMIFLG